jgi:2TM domain-containing protein
MAATETIPELREQALQRLKKRQDFRAHLLVYVLFNLGVWGIWLLIDTGFPWPLFVTFFWGIGLVMNAWEFYWRRPITEADVQREIEHLRR